MTHKIFLVLICLIAVNANARQVITGSLTDKETKTPVDGAEIELLQLADSSLADKTITNTEGLFIFYKADTLHTYCLRIKHLHYKTTLSAVASRKGSKINNMGSIELEPNTFNLKEIVVNGSKVSVTELGDRTIYGIPAEFKKSSIDGIDLLRKVPSIQIDYLNEDITVNGKTNIKIEVDGVTRDKAYLKRLHPTQISKMEVITSPSGKYDADVDAVINVITNPAMRYGLKGMANLGAMPISADSYMGMFNGSLDYGLEKISYYASANYVPQNFTIGSNLNRSVGSKSTQQNTSMLHKGTFGNANVGLIYDPDEYNDFNLNVSFNNSGSKSENNTWNYLSSNAAINSIFKTVSNSKNNDNGLTSSLFYKHKFDKKTQHGLEAELNYFNSLNKNTSSDFQNSYYNIVDTTEFFRSALQKEFTDTNVQNIWGQTNYTLPFDSVYTFNIGVSGNYNNYRTNNTSSLTTAFNMDYSDLRIGSYAEIARIAKKGSIRIGSRFETSQVTINSSEPHNYSSPLPYANGSLKFDDKNSIKLAYSRRVIRPSSGQLNPFVSVMDTLTVSHGNPNLKPAYRDNVQFTYNARVEIKKLTFNLSPQLFYEYKTGLIQNILSLNSNTKLYESMPTNISNGYEAGFGLSLNSQIGKIMFNSNFRYAFNHIDQYLDQIDATNQRSWDWNSFVMFPLPKNFQFMAMASIKGPQQNGQMEIRSSSFTMAGFSKQFLTNHSIRLFAFNPFAEKFFENKTTIKNSNLYQKQSSYMNSKYSLMFMYSYSFKLGKSIDKAKHNVEQQVQDKILNLPVF